MNPVDAVWLFLESHDTPMHFATLMTFARPAGAKAGYERRLVNRLRAHTDVQAPWNLRLPGGPLGRLQPVLLQDHDVDLEYHLRHEALPRPGGEPELHALIARLHGEQLDMSRPLWECHLIEGLRGGRFALYTKIHHALLDGTSGLRLLMGMLSPRRGAADPAPMWVIPATPTSETRPDHGLSPAILARGLGGGPRLLTGFSRGLLRTARAAVDGGQALTAPYANPRCLLNQTVTAPRDYAIEDLDLAEVKRQAKALQCTVNDVVLFVCGTALRRFLQDAGALPARQLTAAVPVNLRGEDDDRLGNAVSQLYVGLGTNVDDPRTRLQSIKRSAAAAKAHMQALPEGSESPYMLLLTGPYVAGMTTGLGGHAPVPYSLNISNVPGPAQTLYFGEAELTGFYPLSFLMHGGTLCILCTSYAGRLVLTLTAARRQLPDLDRLAGAVADAFEEVATLAQETVAAAS